jgi:hypothetical protein
VITIAAYDEHIDRVFLTLRRAQELCDAAGVDYRVVGGMAVFLHLSGVEAVPTRSTNDVDIAIERSALVKLASAAPAHGLEYRQVAGVDMLIEAARPKARTAIHLIFVREKVRPGGVEPIPGLSPPVRTVEGVLLAPIADLVRMKLTSFRFKDKMHLQDLDQAGLINPEIESGLTDVLRHRLTEVRAGE